MTPAKIYIDDRLTDWHDPQVEPELLLKSVYVYTTVNTVDRRPLLLKEHLRYVADSFEALYGTRPQIDVRKTAEHIGNLLYYGFYPDGGNTVDIMILPAEQPRIIIAYNAPTVERGYALSPKKLRAAVVNYEIAFEQHKSAVSLAAAHFADDYAVRNGADAALRANRAGCVISSGDNPIYAVRGRVIATPAVGHGARASVERDLMASLCRTAGIELTEEDIPVAQLADYEELMFFSPRGLHSVARLGEVCYHNITAHTLEGFMSSLKG